MLPPTLLGKRSCLSLTKLKVHSLLVLFFFFLLLWWWWWRWRWWRWWRRRRSQ